MGARNELEEPERNNDEESEYQESTKKVVTLVQTSSHYVGEEKIGEAVEEGETYGNFEVADVNEVKCNHPKVVWHLDTKVTDLELPSIGGSCQVCGDRIPVEVGFPDEEEEK